MLVAIGCTNPAESRLPQRLNVSLAAVSPKSFTSVELDSSLRFRVPPESSENAAPLYLYWYIGDRLVASGSNLRELGAVRGPASDRTTRRRRD